MGGLSWGQSCAAAGKYGVDTRLGNFLSWSHSTMTEVDQRDGDANMKM